MTMLQNPKLSFTMILVAGNEHPILATEDLEQLSTDKMTLAIQKLTRRFDSQKSSYMFLDGANIARSGPRDSDPSIFEFGTSFSPSKKIEEDIIRDGKKTHMSGFRSESHLTHSTNLFIYRQDRVGAAAFINSMMGEKSQSLFLSPLSSLLLVNQEDRPENRDYYPNQLAISRESINDTVDWLKSNLGQYKPSMVLCASGIPLKENPGLFAFPSAGEIHTYKVTFDKGWSVKLKDTIRIQ